MNYIYDEIKQHDAIFIEIPTDSKLFKSHKLYVVCLKVDDNEPLFISINSGEHLIKYSPVFDNKPMQYKIYEIIEGGEIGVKSFCDIFYNFCNNYLSNGFTNANDYLNLTIHVVESRTFLNGYAIEYCTFDDCKKLSMQSEFESALTINNIDDLDKYPDIMNLKKSILIFLKL